VLLRVAIRVLTLGATFFGRGRIDYNCPMVAADDIVPVTVVVPTIGRADLLSETLEALARCRPRAAELLVIDQSDRDQVQTLVKGFAEIGARHQRSNARGLGRARNDGLRAARQECVMFIDDDCSVASDWVGVGYGLASRDPSCLWTGRVLPLGDPAAVPSTKDDPEPHDFTGAVSCGALYPNNMVLPRSAALTQGGFDESLIPAAEDCDFCYRWLRAGRPLRYEPTLVVHHREWRPHEDLVRLYVNYAHGQGLFYGKHLRLGDLTVLRFLAFDLYGWLRSLGAAVLSRRPRWSDPRRGVIRGLPRGLVEGWRRTKRTPG
jgi:glycosyltransferase involved in cell wall biosynthesis